MIFRITEHQQPDWTLFSAQADSLREQEAAQQRNRLFEGYVQSLRDRYSVDVNQDLIDSVVG